MTTPRDAYARLLSRARRFCRDRAEAEDLLQDALLIALQANRSPLAEPADERWLIGVLRNRAAMDARTAIRRRMRESASAMLASDPEPAFDASAVRPWEALLEPMPPAARAVALLILHGMNADEIRWVHQLSATAFRQRLTSIRKALQTLPVALRAEALATALRRPGAPALETGLIRRALIATLARLPGVGSHDPDGHLLLIAPGAHRSDSGGNRRGRRTST